MPVQILTDEEEFVARKRAAIRPCSGPDPDDNVRNTSVVLCSCPAFGGADHSGESGPVIDLETAKRLYDEGYTVCPTSGMVWDQNTCPDCDGSGEYRHYPLDDAYYSETLPCSNCAGDGWVPEIDYTRSKPDTPAGCAPTDQSGVYVATEATMRGEA